MTSPMGIPKVGRLCKEDGCSNKADRASGLCLSHGGGRLCQAPECTNRMLHRLFCKEHGGGKKCMYEECKCKNSAQSGSVEFCGKLCLFRGGGICYKNKRARSMFCITHGGGNRCKFPDCTTGARSPADFCMRHGGGKRCLHEGCGKIARVRSDFCKAH